MIYCSQTSLLKPCSRTNQAVVQEVSKVTGGTTKGNRHDFLEIILVGHNNTNSLVRRADKVHSPVILLLIVHNTNICIWLMTILVVYSKPKAPNTNYHNEIHPLDTHALHSNNSPCICRTTIRAGIGQRRSFHRREVQGCKCHRHRSPPRIRHLKVLA